MKIFHYEDKAIVEMTRNEIVMNVKDLNYLAEKTDIVVTVDYGAGTSKIHAEEFKEIADGRLLVKGVSPNLRARELVIFDKCKVMIEVPHDSFVGYKETSCDVDKYFIKLKGEEEMMTVEMEISFKEANLDEENAKILYDNRGYVDKMIISKRLLNEDELIVEDNLNNRIAALLWYEAEFAETSAVSKLDEAVTKLKKKDGVTVEEGTDILSLPEILNLYVEDWDKSWEEFTYYLESAKEEGLWDFLSEEENAIDELLDKVEEDANGLLEKYCRDEIMIERPMIKNIPNVKVWWSYGYSQGDVACVIYIVNDEEWDEHKNDEQYWREIEEYYNHVLWDGWPMIFVEAHDRHRIYFNGFMFAGKVSADKALEDVPSLVKELIEEENKDRPVGLLARLLIDRGYYEILDSLLSDDVIKKLYENGR